MSASPGRAWPHPDTPLSLTKVSTILGVDRRTLERNISDIRTSGKPRSPRGDVVAASQVFADMPEGTAAKPPARDLIKAVGDNPADFEGLPRPETPKARLRLQKKELGAWRRLPPQSLAQEMREAWLRMESRETKNAKRRVLEIAEVMRQRQVPLPEKWITPESVVVFSSMADWAGRAPSHAVWPFLLVGGSRRPVDLTTAQPKEMRDGAPVFLTPREYAESLAAALLVEKLLKEELLMEKDTKKVLKPKRRRRLGANVASD